MYWSRTDGPPRLGETALFCEEPCMPVGLCIGGIVGLVSPMWKGLMWFVVAGALVG
jgi:hypothetical protein